MSSGVMMYGAPRGPRKPLVIHGLPDGPPPTDETGRDDIDMSGPPKKRAVVSVARTTDGLRIKVTVDGILVSEAEVSGASAVLTVAL